MAERPVEYRLNSKIICRYKSLPAGKKVKHKGSLYTIRISSFFFNVAGVSLLIFNPLHTCFQATATWIKYLLASIRSIFKTIFNPAIYQ